MSRNVALKPAALLLFGAALIGGCANTTPGPPTAGLSPLASASAVTPSPSVSPGPLLPDGATSQAWVVQSPADQRWWVGTYGSQGHDTLVTFDAGTAIAAGGQVGITDRTVDGWSLSLFDAATGDRSLLIENRFPDALAVIALPGVTGQLFVADAGTGSVWDFGAHDTDHEVVKGIDRQGASGLTVFSVSASGTSLLHSQCTFLACQGTLVQAGGTVSLAPDLFPVAATDRAVLASMDFDGLRWVIVDIESGVRTALVDPTGLVRRPMHAALPLGERRFLVDSGGQFLAIDADTGTVNVVASEATRRGWVVTGTPIDGRWLLLRHERAPVPGTAVSSDELRSIGVLDMTTGVIAHPVTSLPFLP
jgi:hypothetical protein